MHFPRTFALLILLVSASCAAKPVSDSRPITSHGLIGEWTVERLGESAVRPAGIAYLGFGEDGKIYGSASVNRIMGTWSLNDGTLMLSKLGSTRMAGPPELMDQESQLLAGLEQTTTAVRDDQGCLILLAANGASLIVASPRAE